eukprot:12523237-Ditylum_brightwellii.AAC.1
MVIATQHWPGWDTALIPQGCVNILIVEEADQGMRFGEGDADGWTEKWDGWKTYQKKDGKGDGTGWNSPI